MKILEVNLKVLEANLKLLIIDLGEEIPIVELSSMFEERPNNAGGYSYFCKVCGYQGRLKHHITRHLRTKHAPSQEIKCRFCPRIYKNKQSLDFHRKNSKCAQMYRDTPNWTEMHQLNQNMPKNIECLLKIPH